MNQHVVNAVLDDIKSCSEKNPVLSSKLEAMYRLSGADIRGIVSNIGRRERKMLIVGSAYGYYVAKSYEEYCDAMKTYHMRAMSILETEKILRDYHKPHADQQCMF